MKIKFICALVAIVSLSGCDRFSTAEEPAAPAVTRLAAAAEPAPAPAPAPAVIAAPVTPPKVSQAVTTGNRFNHRYRGTSNTAGTEAQVDISTKVVEISRNGFAICSATDNSVCEQSLADAAGQVTGLLGGDILFRLGTAEEEGQAFFHNQIGRIVTRDFYVGDNKFGQVTVTNVDGNTYAVEYRFTDAHCQRLWGRNYIFHFDADGLGTTMRASASFADAETSYEILPNN